MLLADIKNKTHRVINEGQFDDCLLIFDWAGNLTDCNQYSLDLFDIHDKNELAKQFPALSSKYPPNGIISGEYFVEHIRNAISSGNVDIDWIFSRVDGRLIQTCVKLAGIDAKHALCQIRIRYKDDKTLKARVAMAEEQRVRTMLDAIPAVCTFWDESRTLIHCNQTTVDLFGLSSKQEYLDKFNSELSPAKQPCGTSSSEKALHYVDTAFSTGYSQFDWMHQKPDGTPMPTKITLVRVNWQDRYGIVGFAEDMRERHAEKKLHKDYQQRLRFIIDNVPVIVYVWDIDGNMIDCNEFAVETFSNNRDVKHFLDISTLIQPCGTSSAILAEQYTEQVIKTGKVKFSWTYQKSCGEEIPCEVTLALLQWEGELALVSFARDLRDFIKYQNNEAAMRNRLQSMLDASPMVCAIFDENINVLEVNQEIVNVLKLSSKQEYIDNFFALSPEFQPDGTPTQEKAISAFKNAVETSTGYIDEWIQLASDGEGVPFELFLSRTEFDEKSSVIVYAQDLRERYKLIEVEREAGEMLNRLLEASPMFIEIRDEHLNLVDCNGQVAALFGAASKEAFIEENERYYPEYQPCGTPSKEKETILLNQAMQEGYLQFEFTHLTRDGEELPLEFTYVRLQHNDKTSIIGYAYDLRHIRQLEKQRLEIAEESNKAKTRFLARMSHEIRTPISAVLGLSEIQLRNYAMPPQTEDVFKKIYDSAKSLLTIVNDILDFSKIESGKMPIVNATYNVADLINEASQLHSIYVGSKDIKFQLYVDENLPRKLDGDALRIKQIINNLLTNAFKYTEFGSVTLSIQCGEEEEKDEKEKKEGKEGYITLIISIQDTGVGMTAEQIKDIHELNNDYMRLHEQKKSFVSGTGLGLSIVCSLLQIMEAGIELESEVGRGTCIVVSIPQKVVSPEVLGNEVAGNLQDFKSGKWQEAEYVFEPEPMPYGRVLVVDDVEINLLVAEGLLGAYELTIELCGSGIEAIERVKQGEVYDIIFMDHMMPEMDGIETTEILQGMGYNHPIVALTANAVKGQEEMFMNNGFAGFISKPIDIELMDSYLVRFIKDKHQR